MTDGIRVIHVLDGRLRVVASCTSFEAATAAARLLAPAWVLTEGAAWSSAARVPAPCPTCDELRAELDAVARVRP